MCSVQSMTGSRRVCARSATSSQNVSVHGKGLINTLIHAHTHIHTQYLNISGTDIYLQNDK